MKFLCPNCKAKYQISDEKIAGRTLKMDCRRCNHPIVIRGETAVDGAPGGAAPSRPSPAAEPAARRRTGLLARRPGAGVAQLVAHRPRRRLPQERGRARRAGQAHGARSVARRHQRRAGRPDEARGDRAEDRRRRGRRRLLCWREGFDDWRPLKNVPELAALLRKPAAPPPPAPARPLGRAAPPAAARPARPPAAARPAAPRPAPPAAESARPAARGNVVPIGGRLGAAAAPAIDDYSEMEDEPTRVGTGARLREARGGAAPRRGGAQGGRAAARGRGARGPRGRGRPRRARRRPGARRRR
ncbi:MAG: zinc-ribbon domain-containing protein [Sandaracinaceae bacterium]|nr:zinc-ribbon domain-containing protein [Sandaracinaceae bacterium]